MRLDSYDNSDNDDITFTNVTSASSNTLTNTTSASSNAITNTTSAVSNTIMNTTAATSNTITNTISASLNDILIPKKEYVDNHSKICYNDKKKYE